MATTIDPFIHTKVVVLKENNSTLEAAIAMCENRVGSVVVADNQGHLTGILTDRDLVCGLLAVSADVDIPISEVMTRDIYTVNESASLNEVVNVMKGNGIRRVPVVKTESKGRQKCIGMITLDDLIASQAVELNDLASIARTQIIRKQRFRHRRSHEERLEQTMDRFITAFAKGLNLGEEEALRLIRFVMGCIVQRLHYSGALHVIAQLPKSLQDEMLDLPAGPDRSIDADVILYGVMDRLQLSSQTARDLLKSFWFVLSERIGAKNTFRIAHQLPLDIQQLLLRDSGAAEMQQL